MKKKKIAKIIVCIACLAVVTCYGIYSFLAWKDYQKEQKVMAAGKMTEEAEYFHDQGDIYMQPSAPTEKDDVTIRLRCGRYNVTKAQIQVTLDEGTTWKCYEMKYEKTDDTGYYDLWVGKIPAQKDPYFYRFAVSGDSNETLYLGAKGIQSYQIDKSEMFYVIPGFDTPKWSQGTMWYYIHTGQFFNGDTTNDLYREYLAKDNAYGNDGDAMYRGSGDLQGVKEKLDYIQSLGVKTLALGPYFSSSESVGFGTDNMAAVETAFGNEEALKALIHDVHDRDMKITTDMIISYVPNYSKYYNAMRLFPGDGAYQSKDSQYYDLFRFPQWPYNAVKIWSSMGLNVADKNAAKLIYQNPDSMVLKYLGKDYGLDGYRFDAEESVGNLGFEYEPQKYFTDIIASIKNVSEDKLVLSENCTGISDQYNTLFDSSWQKNGYFAIKDWFSGKTLGSEMLKSLQANLINTARPRALSSYNFLGQHDVVRLWDDTEEQKNDIRAALLLQMTYLGSPVIYYGDEVGLTNGLNHDQFFSPFNWDESQWNYDILNLVKSLGKAREEYSCLRDGVICHGEVDDSALFLVFGRFDKNGAAITLCNKQSSAIEREIVVSRYNVKDGEILTDYLTGATYKVKDGKVKVNVIPGGTLLVTESETSAHRGEYTQINLGKELQAVRTEDTAFEIEGKGSLEGKKDKFGFLAAKSYNNCELSAKVTTDKKAEAVLMLRDEAVQNSAFYAAVVKANELTVLARKNAGGKMSEITSLKLSKDALVKIARESENTFVTYVKENETAEWKRVEKSNCFVEASEELYAGMSSLNGTSRFSQVLLNQTEAQICETFENKIAGSMFGKLGSGAKLQNGKLTLTTKKDNLTVVETNAHSSDFTFKAELSKIKLDNKLELTLAGVMSMADESDAVILARMLQNGEPIIGFGKLESGSFQMNGFVKDAKPDAAVTLQLQRIGSVYTAVATYDGSEWFSVGDRLYSNYTGMTTGVCALHAEVDFEYACFGNSVEDQKSTNTPMTLGAINTSYVDTLQYLEGDKMAYSGNEDSWKDIGAGYEQTSDKGIALLYCENKVFEDVKAEVSIQLKGGKGTAGILIGKQSNKNDLKDCYQIALDSGKKLSISVNGKELASCKLKLKEDTVRLVVRRQNGYLHLYAGEEIRPVLSVYDTAYGKGYVAYYTENEKAAFLNYDITVLKTTWNPNKSVFGTDGVIETVENSSLVSLEGVALTQGIVTFQADTKMTAEDKENNIGVIIGNSFGRKAAYGGIALMFNYKKGTLEAKEGEKILGNVKVCEPGALESISLMIVFRNGKYDIYANQSQSPVLSVELSNPNGGGISLWSNAGTTFFYNTAVCDITGISDMEGLDIVKAWRQVAPQKRYGLDIVKTSKNAYTDNFDSYKGWNQNFYKIKADGADWYIEDGKLNAESIVRTWDIATLTSGIYKDVEVNMRLRFKDYAKDLGSSISITTGKQVIYGGRETGIVFSIYGNGFVSLLDTNTKTQLNGWNTYMDGIDEWFDMSIRVSQNTVTISINGVESYSGPLANVQKGYVALQTDYANVEIDQFSVKPLS